MKEKDELNYDELINDYRTSGHTLKNWCREHNVTESAMQYHMYRKGQGKKIKKKKEDSRFVELVAADEGKTSIHLVISIRGIHITVTEDTDLTLLKRVIGVLEK